MNSRLRTGVGVSNVNTGVSKPQTIDLNNGSYFMFMSIFLYLSYVNDILYLCLSFYNMSFHAYPTSHSGNNVCVCHVHVCACMDKGCKNTCGNFTRLDVGMQLLLAIPQYISQTWLHVLRHQGTFLHYMLLYRHPNSGVMHSFRDDLVAKLAVFTVIQ